MHRILTISERSVINCLNNWLIYNTFLNFINYLNQNYHEKINCVWHTNGVCLSG